MDSREALLDARCGNADLDCLPFFVVWVGCWDVTVSSGGSTLRRKAVALLRIS